MRDVLFLVISSVEMWRWKREAANNEPRDLSMIDHVYAAVLACILCKKILLFIVLCVERLLRSVCDETSETQSSMHRVVASSF